MSSGGAGLGGVTSTRDVPAMRRWRVGELVRAAGLGAGGARVLGDSSTPITGMTYDSREAYPGSLFVALRGTAADGHKYLCRARAQGAVACLVERTTSVAFDCTVVVDDSRAALARVAAAYYEQPSDRLGLIGVTGTKGKTTTTFLLEGLLAGAGMSTGLIGTVDLKVGPRRWRNPMHQTTPESLDVQRYLADMVSAGVDWAVLETSSHALATHRVDGCAFDLVAITNLSHEHLDFHGTFAAYRETKAALLQRVAPAKRQCRPQGVVLNADDPEVRSLGGRVSGVPLITFGIAEHAPVRARDVREDAGGTILLLDTPWGTGPIATRLLGRFNVYNVLAAVALAGMAGAPFESFAPSLVNFAGVPGRLQRIEAGQPFLVVVDYAHNPDSLAQLLTLLRGVTKGRLLVAFGSGGERDHMKRGMMGGLAVRLADYAVFTDEDPRREDPEAILAAIAGGAVDAGGRPDRDFELIPNRARAIARLCQLARPGDTVALCGKGHEQTIEYADHSVPWDEASVARDILTAMRFQPKEPQCATRDST